MTSTSFASSTTFVPDLVVPVYAMITPCMCRQEWREILLSYSTIIKPALTFGTLG